MSVIHNIDGGQVKSSGQGDWGICNVCNKRVDHLIMTPNGEVGFSSRVTVNFDGA